jgi:predicted unusual protein kinase regulating ubiquinone biosynthesis (AarF/ABC1/UbiB family)
MSDENQSNDKVPTSKIARASRFFKSSTKVGMNYAKYYGKKLTGSEVNEDDLDRQNADDMFKVFSELRGSALKVAQLLSMDTLNLSESFTNVMQKAQYSVPPMSAPLAVQTFQKSVGKKPSEVFDKFNTQAKKAASMGQVHEAWKDGKRLAVKIQYPGVGDSIQSDLKMVKGMARRVMGLPQKELEPYFKEVEERLMEEADYKHELETSMKFAEDCAELEDIVFPKYYPELSSDRVIVMEFIDGKHLKEFLDEDPSQEIKTRAAKAIWDFYEFQIHKLRRVNADPHPGNFLFREDGKVGVLDFGCTKVLDDQLYEDYFKLADPHLFEDEDKAREALKRIEIIREDDTQEQERYMIDLFGRLVGLIARPYHEGYFDFTDENFYQELTDVSMEISQLGELRGSRHFLFLNKTYYGLFSLFYKLGAQIPTACQYRDFLREDFAKAAGKEVSASKPSGSNRKAGSEAKSEQ